MEVKLFEIRDSATFIPALAINLGGENESERFLLSRAGFGQGNSDQKMYTILLRLEDNMQSYDPYFWLDSGARTMHVAHKYIIDNFNELESGEVIDVEYILNITKEIKTSEQFNSINF